jgi:hypothetical protein
MNSEDEMIENSDSEGETPRRNGGFTRERATGERKGLESEGGGALRRMEGRGEAGGVFELRKGSKIFGRGGRFSEATETSEGDGGMGNVPSDGLKRVEGVKRTPYGRGGADNCSFEEPGDRVRLSARRGSYGAASQCCIGGENGLISCDVEDEVKFSVLKSGLGGRVAVLTLSDDGRGGDQALLKMDESGVTDSSTDGGTGEYAGM